MYEGISQDQLTHELMQETLWEEGQALLDGHELPHLKEALDLVEDELCLDLEAEYEDDVLCLGGCGAWVPADVDLCPSCLKQYSGKAGLEREARRLLS